MKHSKKIVALMLLFALAFNWSCKKEEPPAAITPEPTPSGETGSVKLEFRNEVSGAPLVFGTKYTNANGDTFTVSKFNYYISNIVLKKEDGSNYVVPESYHIVKHSVASTQNITLQKIPTGNYQNISFMLGVDSARNVSGAQTGDLDPVKASDMYWSWSSGYIFLKLEGSSPQSGDPSKSITYHIGGYGGANKTQRNFNFGFTSTTAKVSQSQTPTIQFIADVNELFDTPNKLNFVLDYSRISAGAGAKKYADNYADMIRLKFVNN